MGDSVLEMIIKQNNEVDSRVWKDGEDFRLPSNWQAEHQEGELAVDVAQTEKEVIVVSTMAGAVGDKLEIYLHNDLLTIRGVRFSPLEKEKNLEHFHQECYWGKFSRTIVLPVDVKGEMARAEYRSGVLVVRIPKKKNEAKIPVIV